MPQIIKKDPGTFLTNTILVNLKISKIENFGTCVSDTFDVLEFDIFIILTPEPFCFWHIEIKNDISNS